jgi:diguanylate cyclase (GGDEF)-like protein
MTEDLAEPRSRPHPEAAPDAAASERIACSAELVRRADGSRAYRGALAAELVSGLEAEQVLSHFHEIAAARGLCRSLRFLSADLRLEAGPRLPQRYSYRYRLCLTAEEVGVLEVTVERPLGPLALSRLDRLAAALALPLRNALLYRRAMLLARTDALTRLGNRGAFEISLETEISRARRAGGGLHLVLLDLDHFKRINDEWGHLAGDRALQHVGSVLRREVRREDPVFRYGGEEFVVLLVGTDAEGAQLTAERIRRTIAARPALLRDTGVPVTASLGVAQWRPADTPSSLFQRADAALRLAKQQGRNQVGAA